MNGQKENTSMGNACIGNAYTGMGVRLGDADYPSPFKTGLEYNPPARGVWNIVHTGMLVPQAHQIFVCAQGCLRGVVLTAMEMNAPHRMSWISVEENDMFDGTMEQDIIDGITEILGKLKYTPRAVLVFLSCIHLFAGCDFEVILDNLRGRFPHIDFTDCYMTPTMRKTVTPDVKMRIQLYDMLKPLPIDNRSVNIIGNDRPTDEDSELMKILRTNGFAVRDITLCGDYDEYLKMSESGLNITWLPTAKPSGESLAVRLGGKHLHLPAYFDFELTEENYRELCRDLEVTAPDFREGKALAEKALKKALEVVGDTPIAVDFTAVTLPFELAKLLCIYGFNVRYIFTDAILPDDQKAFEWLRENRPDIMIYSAVDVSMEFFRPECPETKGEKILAVGQKAAFYCGTDYFVNIVANGGYYGYSGTAKIADLIADAFSRKKDRREIIQHKGWGLCCNAQHCHT